MSSRILDKILDLEKSQTPGQTGLDESESSSISAGFTASTSEAQSKTTSEKDSVVIGKAKHVTVFRLRLFVLVALVCSTIGVALAVYFYTTEAEEDSFEAQFLEDTAKVFETVGSSLDLTLGAVDAFLVSMVSYARSVNSSWPFVTVPDYAVRVAKIASLSRAVVLNQYHLVPEDQRVEWESYSLQNNGWVDEALRIQAIDPTYAGKLVNDWHPNGAVDDNFGPVPPGSGPYLPKWQTAPVVPSSVYAPYNWDGVHYPSLVKALPVVQGKQRVVISEVRNIADPNNPDSVTLAEINNEWVKDYLSEDEDHTEPFSNIYYPVLDGAADAVVLTDDRTSQTRKGKMVAVFTMTFFWRDLIEDILPQGSKGLVVVFDSACNQTFTYQINCREVVYLGVGDRHDSKYDYLETSSSINDLRGDRSSTGRPLDDSDECKYKLRIYPSHAMESDFRTSNPVIFTSAAVVIFAFTSLIFIVYDCLVERRQKKIMKKAAQSSAIVSSLFPSNVRDRLFPSDESDSKPLASFEPTKARLKTFLHGDGGTQLEGIPERDHKVSSRPIADLFPETTVMFADIVGFTAWSSTREPSQVFILLETLYGAFDAVAARRGVFKVETIGDSYVAVAGLPEARPDHAIVMAKFARDCRFQMREVTRDLERELGPDTGDLAIRFGLHSGPVTAGVLRGQKSRFQLFGDTVNTAARMESNGSRNRIQVSQTTADLIVAARKGHWLKPRLKLVEAKGKGLMKTYWVEPKEVAAMSISTTYSDPNETTEHSGKGSKFKRLIDWNTDTLCRLTKQIVSRRNAAMKNSSGKKASSLPTPNTKVILDIGEGGIPMDEVKEIIELPEFDAMAFEREEAEPDSIELPSVVANQIRDFVIVIASRYHNNPFHNFEHASHVGMSVVKLLSRIVAPDLVVCPENASNHGKLASSLHDHTYGITSDPLTQFACVFAALIHDVDHRGVPNSQLVKDNLRLAAKYKGKSVAEQNSVDIAWDLLATPTYDDFRAIICPTKHEMRRFRQLVVNSLIATDIMDKDLKELRNSRWEKAFFSDYVTRDPPLAQTNRKATIVIEHLIQASDVAHTMQHWHVYRAWNERLFEEMYAAYKAGRAEKDPSEFWYEGEIGFFDHYIIPLAKKLSDCGVFGVSSDEYLNYAQVNREEWGRRGQEIVTQMAERVKSRKSDETVSLL